MRLVALTAAAPRPERALAVGGILFDAGLEVYRWDDPAGFNGYMRDRCEIREVNRKTGATRTRVIAGARYNRRAWVGDPIRLVRQFLVHHSGGDGRNPSGMFDTLWRQRGLSVQFALEDDGRVYQFLDARENAWHAGAANRTSVGVECCLYPTADHNPDYYSPENCARRGNLPHAVREEILQGARRQVFVMPAPQQDALARLVAGTWAALGWIAGLEKVPDPARVARFAAPPRWPREPEWSLDGTIPRRAIAGWREHAGLLGHLHVTRNKWDPAGLDWEQLEARVAARFVAFREALREVSP